MQKHEDGLIEWAGFRIPPRAAEANFLIVGGQGSGKTLTLHSLMASVLPQIRAGTDRRAVIFDSKDETLGFLKETPLLCPVHYLNPFASGGAGWDIGADLTDTLMAPQYAASLIPDPSDSLTSDFFTTAARHILQGVLVALILRSNSWTFDDLFDATSTPENLRRTLESAPKSAAVYKQYRESTTGFDSVFAALQFAMRDVREIAAASRAIPSQRVMRLGEWIRSSNSILVVGSDLTRGTASATFNTLIFKTLSRLALHSLESLRRPTTWFFLDHESGFPGAGGLPDLLNDGRPRGVRVAFTVSAIENLKNVYGTQLGIEMACSCGNFSILHLASAATAQWACAMMSDIDTFEYRPEGKGEGLVTVDFANGLQDSNFLRRRSSCIGPEFLNSPRAIGGRVWGCHVSPAFPGAIVRETIYPFASRT